MFNHGRTLLLNQGSDTSRPADFFAEELVPSNFSPLTWPTGLRRIRTILFGADPDRYMLNYRLRQLLTVLHATPLSSYLTDLDPRITYATGLDATLVAAALYVPVSRHLSGDPGARLSILGTPTAPDQVGRMFHSLVLQVTGTELSQGRNTQPLLTDSTVLSFTGGISQLISLLGTGYQVRVNQVSQATSFLVEVINRPQWDLGQLTQDLTRLGEVDFLDVFGAQPAEPMKTFQNLWQQHKEMPMKLSGLLLGMIYKLHSSLEAGNA